MDKSAIDTPSREIDLRNIPVHLRPALRRALEFEARAPAPRSAEEAEQCEEQLRAIADEFFGALLTPVLQRAVRSAAVGDAASALVRHLPRRMRSDGLETVNVRTSRGTTVPVTTPYYREKHARRAKRRPGLYPRHLLRRLLGPTEVRGELRLPAPWRLRKCAGDRSPVVDHASQRERRFDGARDLVQHELEVTPRAAGAPGPARRSPRGKSRGRGGAASPPAAPRTVSRRATPWRCRRRTSAGAPTGPET